MFINQEKGFLQDYITQVWVKVTGQILSLKENKWLFGPTGNTSLKGKSYVQEIAKNENLEIETNFKNSGLIDDFSIISDQLPHPNIVHFYEHTTNYAIDVKAKWKLIFKPIGWLLTIFFSKRLQQLNLPTSNKTLEKGLKSEIIKLKKQGTKRSVWTIWHRKSLQLDHVIFSGIYTYCTTPDKQTKMKVIFPLPNGNATVLFDINVKKGGSFELESKGRKIGEPGFYFIVNKNKKTSHVRLVKSMHEKLTVSVDSNHQVYALHQFKFWNITFLELNYKMILNKNL